MIHQVGIEWAQRSERKEKEEKNKEIFNNSFHVTVGLFHREFVNILHYILRGIIKKKLIK